MHEQVSILLVVRWEGFVTYVRYSATQDAEAVHDAIRPAGSEVIARVRFADVSCHGTCEVGIGRVGGSKAEVVDSRGVCGDVLVVELWRELNRAAYMTRSAGGRKKDQSSVSIPDFHLPIKRAPSWSDHVPNVLEASTKNLFHAGTFCSNLRKHIKLPSVIQSG